LADPVKMLHGIETRKSRGDLRIVTSRHPSVTMHEEGIASVAVRTEGTGRGKGDCWSIQRIDDQAGGELGVEVS
jgi:hypothetical protein